MKKEKIYEKRIKEIINYLNETYQNVMDTGYPNEEGTILQTEDLFYTAFKDIQGLKHLVIQLIIDDGFFYPLIHFIFTNDAFVRGLGSERMMAEMINANQRQRKGKKQDD